jgi:hypothetical protein
MSALVAAGLTIVGVVVAIDVNFKLRSQQPIQVSTSKLGPMFLRDFNVQRPTIGTPVPVECSFHTGQVQTDPDMWFVKLEDRHEGQLAINYAWVSKISPAGKKLYEALKDGSSREFILEIEYRSGPQPVILGIIEDAPKK